MDAPRLLPLASFIWTSSLSLHERVFPMPVSVMSFGQRSFSLKMGTLAARVTRMVLDLHGWFSVCPS